MSLGENGLRYCPVEVADIYNTNVIFGPNLPRIRGATTRDTKVLRTKEQIVGIPRDFYRLHKMVTITDDVMFVRGIPFLVTFSRKIKSWTAEFIPKQTERLLAKSLKKVPMPYARGVFIVKLAVMDKEFDIVKEHLQFLEVNMTDARDYVAEIERELRKVKERVRCTSSKFPFQFIPTMILIYTLYNVC